MISIFAIQNKPLVATLFAIAAAMVVSTALPAPVAQGYANKSAFCNSLDNRRANLVGSDGRITKKIKDYNAFIAKWKKGRQDRRVQLDNDRSTRYANADSLRKAQYDRLTAEAGDDATKQAAVKDFTARTQQSVSERRAVDQRARAAYRNQVDQVSNVHWGAVQNAMKQLRTDATDALNNARDKCKNKNLDGSKIKSTFESQLSKAREKFKATRTSLGKLKTKVQPINQQRIATIRTANQKFKADVDKYISSVNTAIAVSNDTDEPETPVSDNLTCADANFTLHTDGKCYRVVYEAGSFSGDACVDEGYVSTDGPAGAACYEVVDAVPTTQEPEAPEPETPTPELPETPLPPATTLTCPSGYTLWNKDEKCYRTVLSQAAGATPQNCKVLANYFKLNLVYISGPERLACYEVKPSTRR